MNQNGDRSIEDAFLGRNDLFGLEYNQGLIFCSIRDYSDTKYKPYSNLEDIEGQTSLDNGFTRLNDSEQDNDILFLDKSDDTFNVLHTSIGIQPAMIRMQIKYPESGERLYRIPNLDIPSSSDPEAYVDGSDSPYSEPTDAAELVIPPGIHNSFNFYNPDTDDHEPLLNIKMRNYRVELLNPRGRNDERNSIRRITAVGSSIPTFTVGSMNNQASFNMGDVWKVDPISLQRAREVVN